MRRVAVLSAKLMRSSVLLAIVLVLSSAIGPLGVSGQTTSKALGKNEIIGLLKDVPSTRVEMLAKERGISFEVTHAVETQLKQAGATERLLKTLRELSVGGSAKTTPGTAQPTSPGGGPPVLQIEVTPGGTQVYIDDELVGSTSSQGRLKLSQLTPGQHHVRLALPGRRDYEQTVTLVAGQTVPITTTLEEVKATPVTPPGTPGVPGTQPHKPPLNGPQMETFYVAHDHGKGGQTYCMGWLSVGRGKVEFRSTSEPSHSFSYPLTSMKDYGPNDRYMKKLGGFHIRIRDMKDGIFNFAAVSPSGQFLPPTGLWNAFQRALGLQP